MFGEFPVQFDDLADGGVHPLASAATSLSFPDTRNTYVTKRDAVGV